MPKKKKLTLKDILDVIDLNALTDMQLWTRRKKLIGSVRDYRELPDTSLQEIVVISQILRRREAQTKDQVKEATNA